MLGISQFGLTSVTQVVILAVIHLNFVHQKIYIHQ